MRQTTLKEVPFLEYLDHLKGFTLLHGEDALQIYISECAPMVPPGQPLDYITQRIYNGDQVIAVEQLSTFDRVTYTAKYSICEFYEPAELVTIASLVVKYGGLPTKLDDMPVVYADGDGDSLCPECANVNLNSDVERYRPVAFYIVTQDTTNPEAMDVSCDECGKVYFDGQWS